MADRADDISFDPKTWVGVTETPAVATPTTPVAPVAGGRTALALGLSALLLLTAAGAAYLTRVPVIATPPAALR